MRLASNLMLALATVVVGLGVWFYLWVTGMACAYSTSGNRCFVKAPWALGREDFLILFALPSGTALLLVFAAVVLRRQSMKRQR